MPIECVQSLTRHIVRIIAYSTVREITYLTSTLTHTHSHIVTLTHTHSHILTLTLTLTYFTIHACKCTNALACCLLSMYHHTHTHSLYRKNVVYNYSDAEAKVRESTSNDPWGPSSALMGELAEYTYHVQAYGLVMGMLWKRLNDHGKNWRHVYKVSRLSCCK